MNIPLNKRFPFSLPGYYGIIYSCNGEDKLFPIVGEIIATKASGYTTYTLAKWSIRGESVLTKDGTDSSLFSLQDTTFWADILEEAELL